MDRGEPEGRLLGEVASSDVISVTESSSVAAAVAETGQTAWIVVTDSERQPVGLLRRARLAQARHDLIVADLIRRPAIALPATLPVADSVRTWPFHELAGALTELDGVIVVSDASPALGVWSGPLFSRYLLSTRRGGSVDTGLGGKIIRIGRLALVCAFADPVTHAVCGASRSFSVPPKVLPDCRNPRHLTPHKFSR